MLIGQISIKGHNASQCFAFYVIMSALNKTVRYNRIEADDYREILSADLGDATTETWKYVAIMSGCVKLRSLVNETLWSGGFGLR